MIEITDFVPFYNTILTNKNFDKIEDFENYNLLIKKINDYIEISFKLTYSTNVFIHQENNIYYISLNSDLMYEMFNKNDVIIYYKTFDKLILTKDKYEFIDDENLLWTIPLKSNKAINILNNWITTYKNIIQNINPENLIIELSAGIDTRILTYFWRNTGKIYDIYTENDNREIKYANDVIDYINNNFKSQINAVNNYCEFKGDQPRIVLNGMNLINGKLEMIDFESYEQLCISRNNMATCQFSRDFVLHQIRDIEPFLNKEYLKIKGSFNSEIKLALFYLMCEEKNLYNLPIISYHTAPFNINEYDVKDIVNYLKNKIIL